MRGMDWEVILEKLKDELPVIVQPWEHVWEETRRQDIVLIITVPVALIVIQALVIPENWGFPIDAPSIFASPDLLLKAFTSSFVHEGVGLESGHLWGNVLSYLILMTAIYPLSIVAGWRKKLFWSSIAFILFVPFLVQKQVYSFHTTRLP